MDFGRTTPPASPGHSSMHALTAELGAPCGGSHTSWRQLSTSITTTQKSAPSLLPAPRNALKPTATAINFSQHSTGTARGWEPLPRHSQAGNPSDGCPCSPNLSHQPPSPHGLAPVRGFTGPNTGEAAPCTAQGKPDLQNHCPAPTRGQGRICLSSSLGRKESCSPCPASLSCRSQHCPHCRQQQAAGAGLQEPQGIGLSSWRINTPTFPTVF